MAHYLIVRTSSLGDVALSLRLVYAVAKQYPEHRFTYLMKPSITGILVSPPHNLEAMAIDIKHSDRSLFGLISLSNKLIYDRFDAIIDLQRSWRSRFLSRRLRCCRARIRCTRIAKSAVVKRCQEHISLSDTEQMLSLFADTFARAGLHVQAPYPSFPRIHYPEIHPNPFSIGIAPLQGEQPIQVDVERTAGLISALREAFPYATFYLLGVKKELFSKYSNLFELLPRGVNFITGLSFAHELAYLSQLSCLITVDNSMAHLARLMDTPFIEIPSIHTEENTLLSIIHQIQSITSEQPVSHECENQ
ncbi:glycosyltransferase family 9 protein [Porphyromonas endodontalis]|uniref:glycosyltransferase family 9 protein n=1 Tax=Porphyromonas endodontalis TaxID=28124 RepID=UPI00248F40D7|nr:hypothetical protein [Porphyromonas endodontalis]